MAAALTWLAPSAATAQEAGGAPPEEGEAPEGQPPEQIEATKLFKEGKALSDEKKYEEAIEKFDAAYELFPDPGLLFVIAEAYQVWGNELSEAGQEDEAYEKFGKAAETYRKFIEVAAPNEAMADAVAQADERARALEEAIAAREEQKQREKEAAELAKQKEEERKRKAEEERRRKLAERKGLQMAIDAMVVGGADQDLSAVGRMMAGGLIGKKGLALEGHIGLDGFLRVDDDKGVTATSFTLLDLGVRYGFDYHFVGPWLTAGGSFGLFGGKPRERKLSDDTETCEGFDSATPGQCSFNIDKNLSARLGVGYGFQASEKSTVAVRVEAQYWAFSVDDEQDLGSPPAALVEKPQTSLAIMVGLEFMRWK